MAYPAWDDATSYPVGSIVTFNNLTYIATSYHNPASTEAPNVEMGTDPYNPIFESQRAWTIYATLPPGYQPSQFGLSPHILIKKIDYQDDYVYFGQYAPGPYGNDQGYSTQHFAGSPNNPSTPCPAAKCLVSIYAASGHIYGTSFQLVKTLFNPVLAPSGTYYIDGPAKPDGETNTLYVWWGIQSPSCFRRSVKLFCITINDLYEPVMLEETFTPTDNDYNVGSSTPIEWFAPGNQSVTFTSTHGLDLQNAYEVAEND